MRKELQERLVNRWPSWFDFKGSVQETLMPFGIEHGDGWFDILWHLCEELEPIVADSEGEPFRVVQVKEKLGGLRFYTNSRHRVICTKIESAEQQSFTICEICGEPGALRKDKGWFRTRCDNHQDVRPWQYQSTDEFLDEVLRPEKIGHDPEES